MSYIVFDSVIRNVKANRCMLLRVTDGSGSPLATVNVMTSNVFYKKEPEVLGGGEVKMLTCQRLCLATEDLLIRYYHSVLPSFLAALSEIL